MKQHLCRSYQEKSTDAEEHKRLSEIIACLEETAQKAQIEESEQDQSVSEKDKICPHERVCPVYG